jgi:hypothetical protein
MLTRSTGDDIAITATVYFDGVEEDQTGNVVKAALALPDRSALAAGTTAVVCDVDGAKVTATWPKATTGTIVPGAYLFVLQIDDQELAPIPMTIVRGVIA